MNFELVLLGLGGAGSVAAALADPSAAASAADQVWPAFVLVGGLLLVGLVAATDGLFAAAGRGLVRRCGSGLGLLAAMSGLVLVVTAVLNLDTSVAFLAPVAVSAGKSDDRSRGLLLSACLLLSNAGSLLLPGSNLTNLIVLGRQPLAGGVFAGRMLLPWLVAGVITAVVVAVPFGLSGVSGSDGGRGSAGSPSRFGVGAVAIALASAAMLVLAQPALYVLGVGVAAVVLRRMSPASVRSVLGLPVLIGLFGVAVGLGTVGRVWTYPSDQLSHLSSWATAAVGAGATVVMNNLPAAALLSAHRVAHPLSLLIGLNVGPNLFVTGSLAWVLWYRSASTAGGQPDIRSTVRLGLISAPLAVVGAVLVLGAHT